MIVKLTLAFLCAAAASGNPAAGKPWHWKSPRPLVTPTGITIVKSPRIVGGSEVTPHSYPHQVGLFIDNMYFCGGSLISNEWVLTAAHCMDGAVYVDVVMGAHNIAQNEDTQVTMTSTDFKVHENWNSNTLLNDIAIIRLPSPVTFNAYIDSVGLPSSDVSLGTIVTATGWGKTAESDSGMTDILREVDVPVVTCLLGSDTNICTGSSDGKGVCNGDSGGPLNRDGNTYGIASYVVNDCESGYPNAFTRVFSFLDWIAANTGVTP